jgi:hypothetical protein
MELPFDPMHDMGQTIDEIESFLKMPLEDKTPSGYDINKCRHLKVYLDGENHTVECQDCKKTIDPFWYLQLLAKEWRNRRYQDSLALKAWRDIQQKELERGARGKHFAKPTEGEGRKCWEAWEMLTKQPPDFVVAHGKYWYVGKDHGETMGDYVKQQLAEAYRKMGLAAPDCCG